MPVSAVGSLNLVDQREPCRRVGGLEVWQWVGVVADVEGDARAEIAPDVGGERELVEQLRRGLRVKHFRAVGDRDGVVELVLEFRACASAEGLLG